MGNSELIVKAIVYGGAIIGTGYGLMKFTVPSEAEMKQRLSPALRREAEQQEKNNARHQALMDHMRAAAQDEKAAAWQSEAPLENSKSA